MGHIGLTPQSATALGGFKAQGRTAAKAAQLVRDALALEAAGCFSLVLEAVPSPVAAKITELLAIPTIGIGAGADVDGQVLVWHDLLGLYDGHAPRFVKQYAQLAAEIQRAVEAYVGDVRERRFPEEVHTYGMPAEELAAFEAELGARRCAVPRCPASAGRLGSRCLNPGERLKPLTTLRHSRSPRGGQDGERRHDHGRERQRAERRRARAARTSSAGRAASSPSDQSANASPIETTTARPAPSSEPPVRNQS